MLSNEDYIKALEKLKGRDRLGVLSEFVGTGVGAASGVAASGTIASLAGASTFLGSSTLGTLMGGVFVTSTPVGWVVGATLAAGALGYGIAKLAHDGGKNDEIRSQLEMEIEIVIKNNQDKQYSKKQYNQFINKLKEAIDKEKITQEKSNLMIKLVESKKLKVDIAIKRIEGIMI